MSNLDDAAMPITGVACEDGLTKREQACISLLIPESGDVELDDLIRKSRRQNLAGEALQGFMSSAHGKSFGHHYSEQNKAYCEVSILMTDELIKQLESE